MTGFRATKTVKEIKFEGVWVELEAKNVFPEITIHKIIETHAKFPCETAHYREI